MNIRTEFADDKIRNNLAATKIFSSQFIQYHIQTIVIDLIIEKVPVSDLAESTVGS